MNCADRTLSQSWKYLFIHTEIALSLADAPRAKVESRPAVADAYWTKLVEYIMVNESRIETVFDPWAFIGTWQSAFAEPEG